MNDNIIYSAKIQLLDSLIFINIKKCVKYHNFIWLYFDNKKNKYYLCKRFTNRTCSSVG